MGAARMLQTWTRTVGRWLPDAHGHQVKTLALMAWSMCCAGLCQTTIMALAAPGKAKVASTRRRFERWLANSRVEVASIAVALSKALLAHWSGQTVKLFVDETALGPWLCCMKVSVGYRRRALPLAWVCYVPGQLPIPQPEIVEVLLRQAGVCLPKTVEVVLMADRGLSWPLVVDLCRELGWHYLLRVQGHTAVQRSGCPTVTMGRLASRPGQQWSGSGAVFRAAGWRITNMVACWEAGEHEPWLLITDLPPRRKRCSEYRQRMWQEEAFRDEKSHGFCWQRSCVRQPDHADRLLLALLLAMWMAIAAGTELIETHRRDLVETTARPSLSVFQLGYRWYRFIMFGHSIRSPTLWLLPNEEKSVG